MSKEKLLALHSERVAVYKEFEEAFRRYLIDEQGKIFSIAVSEATTQFQRISTEVMQCIKLNENEEFKALGKALQREEQEKLVLTAKLQAAKKTHFIDNVRRDKEEAAMRAADLAGTNVLTPHNCHHDDIQSLAQKPQPTYSQIYDRDAGSAAKGLQQCIERINEIIAEIRYV